MTFEIRRIISYTLFWFLFRDFFLIISSWSLSIWQCSRMCIKLLSIEVFSSTKYFSCKWSCSLMSDHECVCKCQNHLLLRHWKKPGHKIDTLITNHIIVDINRGISCLCYDLHIRWILFLYYQLRQEYKNILLKPNMQETIWFCKSWIDMK